MSERLQRGVCLFLVRLVMFKFNLNGIRALARKASCPLRVWSYLITLTALPPGATIENSQSTQHTKHTHSLYPIHKSQASHTAVSLCFVRGVREMILMYCASMGVWVQSMFVGLKCFLMYSAKKMCELKFLKLRLSLLCHMYFERDLEISNIYLNYVTN